MSNGWRGANVSRLSVWEIQELLPRARAAAQLPKGERICALRALASEYGVCQRTVERYARRDLALVKVSGWTAAFSRVKDGPPRQLTPWERAA